MTLGNKSIAVAFKCRDCGKRAELCAPPTQYFNEIDSSTKCLRKLAGTQVTRCPGLWPEYLKADRKLRQMT
jgi:hypothetical protein